MRSLLLASLSLFVVSCASPGSKSAAPSEAVKYRYENTLDLRNDNSLNHVVVTGYDDSRTALQIVDSQGAGRVGGGVWWMAYRVADAGVIQDACSLFV